MSWIILLGEIAGWSFRFSPSSMSIGHPSIHNATLIPAFLISDITNAKKSNAEVQGC